jgi:hypothetical protein
VNFEGLVCDDDGQAIEKAKRFVYGHDVELWSGTRFVARLTTDGKPGLTFHEVIDGRMMPKK